MLTDAIIESINAVDSVQSFNELMNLYKTSTASQDLKDEAIRELKARKSIFCLDDNITSSSVLEDIEAGKADIDDIG